MMDGRHGVGLKNNVVIPTVFSVNLLVADAFVLNLGPFGDVVNPGDADEELRHDVTKQSNGTNVGRPIVGIVIAGKNGCHKGNKEHILEVSNVFPREFG